MSRNLNQIPTQATSILGSDKMYIARSPFGVTDDRYILGSDILAQLGSPLTTKGDLYTFTTVPARLPVGTINGQILQVNSGATTGLAWSTPTYPSASGASGKILRADGTNNVYSTATFADTYSASNLLFSNGANTIVGLATANSSVLVTSVSGVPSLSTTLPSGLTIPGYAHSGANSDITSLLGLTGKIEAPTAIADTSGNNVLAFSYSGSSVNSLTITNASTGNTPSLTAGGSDTNLSLAIYGQGTGLVQLASPTGTSPLKITPHFQSNVFGVSFDIPTITADRTITLPDTSGTLAFTSNIPSLPLSLANGGTNASLSASAGGIVYSGSSALAILSGTATANQVVLSGASATPSWSTATYLPTLTANGIVYASATNVMAQIASAANSVLITSSGSVPSLSQTLPAAVQGNITTVGTITTGVWQGSVIALAYGGTNANLTASNGGIVWTNATQMQVLSGTATANQMLQSGSTATPSWSTSTWPATTTANQLLYSSFNNVVAGLTSAASSVLVTSVGSVPSWSTTLPSGLTIPGYAASGANADITSMSALQYISGASGATHKIVTFTDSDVNGAYLDISNNTAGNGVKLSVLSSATNEGFNFISKGTGPFIFISGASNTGAMAKFLPQGLAGNEADFAFGTPSSNRTYTFPDASGTVVLGTAAVGQIIATATNDNASAGNVGEYVSSTIVEGSAVSLTTNTPKNITSISLTAGDWDVSGSAGFTGGAATVINSLQGGANSTSATMPSLELRGMVTAGSFVTADTVLALPPQRFSLSTTTTIYLVANAIFTTSTCLGFGILRARRIR